MRLESKTVIVTGAGRGMGRTIAEAYAREGANLALCSRTAEETEATADLAGKLGSKTLARTVDVAVPKAVDAFVDEVAAEFGRIDVLVNNAAVGMGTLPREAWSNDKLDLSIFEQMWRINVIAPVRFIQAVVPHMSSGGSIINHGSGLGIVTAPGYAAYCMTKHALHAMTEVAAKDLKESNIAVNTLHPGGVGVRTKFTSGAPRDRWGKLPPPEIVNELAVFLATQDASGVTGETIEALAWNAEHGIAVEGSKAAVDGWG